MEKTAKALKLMAVTAPRFDRTGSMARRGSARSELEIERGERPTHHGLFCELSPLGEASHSCSFDQRRRPETLRTAMATAFFWPTSTTSFFPRVTPVYSRLRCSMA